MRNDFGGIVPVMLTPMLADGKIDWVGLENLVEWYVDCGCDTLFAVCQSSEMQYLSLNERVELAKHVVSMARGRLPVIASGHISESLEDQRRELQAMAETGVDGLVLVTNRLDPANEGTSALRHSLDVLLPALPAELPLGLYECPAPYRRLLSDDELKFCRDSERFAVLKDVSCDLETIRRRVQITKGSPLAIVNANAAIALEAMEIGSRGFAGVFTNFHPDLYAWLYANKNQGSAERAELKTFLALSAMAESLGYPKLAKHYHVQLGTFGNEYSRTIDYSLGERHWAYEALLNEIEAGTQRWRLRLANGPGAASVKQRNGVEEKGGEK